MFMLQQSPWCFTSSQLATWILSRGCMKLRTHPLMSYRGVSNWPPAWVGTNERHEPLRGERGILEDVVPSQTENASRFFLVIEDEGSKYVGCLLFQDLSFCRQIYKLMIAHRGDTIARIGDIDLSHTL